MPLDFTSTIKKEKEKKKKKKTRMMCKERDINGS